jgi:tetratricopeptide (TPR) repeat protein
MDEHLVTRACGGLLVVALVFVVSASATAQTSQHCDTDECLTEQLTEASARIQQTKAAFVDALRAFLEGASGTHGDEGRELRRELREAAGALSRWHGAVRTYASLLAPVSANVDVHVALASVHLDHGSTTRALSELSVAARLAPWRADVFILQALAHDADRNAEAAAAAFTRASSLAPDSPLALYGAGRQLMRLGQVESAADAFATFAERQVAWAPRTGQPPPFMRVGLLREAVGVAPLVPLARYRPGFELLARAEYDDALEAFTEAVEYDPLAGTDAADALAPGGAALRSGDIGAAIAHFEGVVARSPGSSEARRMLGVALGADERYEPSVTAFGEAIRLNALDERARLSLAGTLVAAGRLEEAEQMLRDTIASIPESARAHYELARLYQSLERRRDAIVHLQAVVAAHPLIGLDHLFDLIGTLSVAEGDVDGALDAFSRRVDAHPNNAIAHRRLGLTFLQQGHHEHALAEFAAALLLDDGDAEAYTGRAQVYLQRGSYAAAEEASRRALERDPEHLAARYALGASLLRLGRAEEGAAEVRQFEQLQAAALERDQRRWQLTQVKQEAWARADEGQLDEAAGLLREALALEPDSPATYLALGVILRKSGRHDEALEALERAESLGAEPAVHVHLAELYEHNGRMDESRRQREIYASAKSNRLRRASGTP